MKKGFYALCVFLCVFLFAVINSTHGALLSNVIGYYRLEDSQKGMAVAAQNIGCLIALVSSLWVMGRLPKPQLLWMSSAAMVLIILPMGLPPAFPVLVGLFLLIGIAVGYSDTIASSSIADLFEGKAASRMMGVLHAVFGMAGILSPLAFQALMANGVVEWNGIYLLVAAMGGLILLYAIPVSMKRARQPAAAGTTTPRLSVHDLKQFFNGGRSLLLLTIFFYSFYLSGISIWINRFIGDTLGGGDLGTMALSLFWLGLTASRLVVPLLRVPSVTLIRWSSLIAAALLVIGIFSGSAMLMCVVAAAVGFVSGATIPLILHVVSAQYRTNTLLATTLTFLSLYVGQTVCPPLMGMVESQWGLTIGMLICPVALALSALFAFLLKPEADV